MNARRRFLFLTLIMVCASGMVAAVIFAMLYRHEIHQKREMLIVTARSQARLIEAVARYDAEMAPIVKQDLPGHDAAAVTLSQIIDAHEQFKGFGKTGEFTLARREGDQIVFVLRHRLDGVDQPTPIPFDSELAEPMRRALNGLSGSVIGLDYRGATVLAAHEPVGELNLGIVAKIDLAEIRAPFIRCGLSASFVALLVVLAGTALFSRVANPIITRLEAYAQDLELEIEERTRAEEESRRLRNYLANTIDSMPSILVGVDAEGRVTQWNDAATKATGLDAQSALGQPLQQAFPRLAREMANVQKALQSYEPVTSGHEAYSENGTTRYQDITIYPLTVSGLQEAVVCVDDVTERVRLEEAMVQGEKMLSVGGLAVGMAHELNNPLAGILQNLQVLQHRLSAGLRKNDEAAKAAGTSMEAIEDYMRKRDIPSMIDAVLRAGGRASEVVDNVLSFARKGSRQKPCDVAELLDRTIEIAASDYDLRTKFRFCDMEIVREYEPDVPRVPCEEGKVQQVLFNLLRNAAEAVQEAVSSDPERDRRVTLRVTHDQTAALVRVEIEDNGTGMDEATRKRVFEPFFTTKPPDRGTGLGLSVSYFIIAEHHGGAMSVASTLGRGTTFSVDLPLTGKLPKSGSPAFEEDAS